MSPSLFACFSILAAALTVARYDENGIYKNALSLIIVVVAAFNLYFSVEQSARDAALSEVRPEYISTEFGAGVYAMKEAIGTERICLFVLIVALAVMSVSSAKK